jgi:hypothetical protein
MSKKHGKRKKSALARRYGHFSAHEATASVRKLTAENPMVASAAAGAALGAIAAGMSVGSAAAVGAVAGIAVNQTLKK